MSAAMTTSAGVVGPNRCQSSRLAPKPMIVQSRLCSVNHTRKRVCCRSSDALDGPDLRRARASSDRVSARKRAAAPAGSSARSERDFRDSSAPSRTTLIAELPTISHQSAIGRYEHAIASVMPTMIDTAIKTRVSGSPDVAPRVCPRSELDKRPELIGIAAAEAYHPVWPTRTSKG
jgi:hypothetical protein